MTTRNTPLSLSTPLLPRRRTSRTPPKSLLPVRLVLGAFCAFATLLLAHRQAASFPISILITCITVLLGQLLVTGAVRFVHVREEEKDEKYAIEAVDKIIDTVFNITGRLREIRHDPSHTRLLAMFHAVMRIDLVTRAFYANAETEVNTSLRARHYLSYAAAASRAVEGARHWNVVKNILVSYEQRPQYCPLDGEDYIVPRYFVAVDVTQQSIVVAIAGSTSISETITYLLGRNEHFRGALALFENDRFANGYAHCAMRRAAEDIHSEITPFLNCPSRPGYSIVLTGHSLGAGVAILLTKMLLMSNFRNVKCYAFAPCPVFGPMHEVDEEWSDALECFINGDDVVPKLCLSSARILAIEMQAISNLAVSPAQQEEIFKKADAVTLFQWADQYSQHRSVIDATHQRFERLYIPCLHGLHLLLPEKDKIIRRENEDDITLGDRVTRTYGSYLMDRRDFERILVTPSCVRAHNLDSYQTAFAGLV